MIALVIVNFVSLVPSYRRVRLWRHKRTIDGHLTLKAKTQKGGRGSPRLPYRGLGC